jgi:Kinesin motor domain
LITVSETGLTRYANGKTDKQFLYDKIIYREKGNAELVDYLVDSPTSLISYAIAGFNVALLSFGPAGVGKSTMIFGKDSRFKYMEDSSDLISRILFKLLEKSDTNVQIGLSAFQIYKSESSKQEIVNDILAGLNDSACVKDFVNVQITSIDNAKLILDNIKSKCMNWKHNKKDNTFQILPNKSHMFIRVMIKSNDASSSIIIVDSIGYREQSEQILGKKEKDLLEYANHSYESTRYILNELIRQTEAAKNQLPKV